MRTPLLYLSAAFAALFLSGCVSSQTVTGTHRQRTPTSASIAIRQPADGRFEEETYASSGRAVATGLKLALIPHFPAVEISERNDVDYVIKPSILRWEDRATEWSGRPDRISVSLQTYTRKGVLADTTVIEARSSWWTLGGDHPEDLLRKSFASYAQKLAH